MIRCLPILLLLVSGFLSDLHAAGPEDILRDGRASRYLRLRDDQKSQVAALVDSMRATIGDYQWALGKRTNEGRIWQGEVARLKELHDLEFEARKRFGAIVDTLRTRLDGKQVERLDKALENDDIFEFTVRETPFEYINNSPLFNRFNRKAKAYRVVIPGKPAPRETWTYRDLLRVWTTRGFVQYGLAVDQREYAEVPGLQFRETSPSIRSLVVKSPLIVAGTLLTPDLAEREFEVLWEHYEHAEETKEAAWRTYREDNRLDDALLVRLKIATPLEGYYLQMNRYIIYLEDSEGVGYEPDEVRQEADHKLEALEIHIPGRQVEVTDIFGRYTGIPGYKESRWLSYPAEIKYAGQEKLLKLFFPGFDFQGRPIVNDRIESLKLILKPEDGAFPPIELEWEVKRKPPKSLD